MVHVFRSQLTFLPDQGTAPLQHACVLVGAGWRGFGVEKLDFAHREGLRP